MEVLTKTCVVDTGVFLATEKGKNWDEGVSKRKGTILSLEISEIEVQFLG